MAVEGVISSCSEAGDAASAVALAESVQPDVAIVGSQISGDGLAAVEGILRVARNCQVVVVTPSLDPADLLAALRAGALGYLPGSIDPTALRRVVLAVAAGEAAVPRALVADLARELRSGPGGADGVTAREAQVLAMLRRGETTAAIASHLAISPITVRRHISTLMQKVGVQTREALAEADIRLPYSSSARPQEPTGVAG
jgi:DNA-binding NarL/FixJ family response regulator